MSKTSAYKLYVNEQFIKPFYRYVPDNFKITDAYAEETLIASMCWYYCDKIYEKFNFTDVKNNYKQNMARISPKLDYIQAKKYAKREQSKLETFARIKYGIEDLDDNINNPNINILASLYLIYAKLNKKSIEAIKQSKVYKYIKLAYVSETSTTLDNSLKFSLPQLANDLYNNITSLIYDADNFSYTLTQDGTLITNTGHETALTPSEIEEFELLEDDYFQLMQFMSEKHFQQRLIIEMHTLDNGMIF